MHGRTVAVKGWLLAAAVVGTSHRYSRPVLTQCYHLPTAGSRGEGTCSESYKLFRFGSCRPGQGAATVSNPDDIQAGRIELQLTQVVDSGLRQALKFTTAGPSNTAANKKLPEGKKVSSSGSN